MSETIKEETAEAVQAEPQGLTLENGRKRNHETQIADTGNVGRI